MRESWGIEDVHDSLLSEHTAQRKTPPLLLLAPHRFVGFFMTGSNSRMRGWDR